MTVDSFGLQVPAILICLLATFKPFYVRLYERAIQIGGAGAYALEYANRTAFLSSD